MVVKKVVGKKVAIRKSVPVPQAVPMKKSVVAKKLVNPPIATVKTVPVKRQVVTKAVMDANVARVKPTQGIDRVSSGISDLDDVMEGGFEKNSAVLVSGGGGSGKTIFGMQFLMEGITKFDETGVYISFEENKAKFYKHMLRFGWDLTQLESEGRFVFIEYDPEEMAEIVESGGGAIGTELMQVQGKRIVIDSLSAYTVLFDREADQRKKLVDLFTMIESWDATTVVIAEENPSIDKFQSSVMGFMADAIIYLYNIIRENVMLRAMQIAKMRGTKHTQRIFPIMIGESGIKAYPTQDIFEYSFDKKS